MNSRFVFFNAVEGQIRVTIDGEVCGYANDAEQLQAILEFYDVSMLDSFYTSSDVDFCEEEGFTRGAAREIIQGAMLAL